MRKNIFLTTIVTALIFSVAGCNKNTANEVETTAATTTTEAIATEMVINTVEETEITIVEETTAEITTEQVTYVEEVSTVEEVTTTEVIIETIIEITTAPVIEETTTQPILVETTTATFVETETSALTVEETTTAYVEPETTTQYVEETQPVTEPEITTAYVEPTTQYVEETTPAPTELVTEETTTAFDVESYRGEYIGEIEGYVYTNEYSTGRYMKSNGPWTGPTLNVATGTAKEGNIVIYFTDGNAYNNAMHDVPLWGWLCDVEVIGWYDEGYVRRGYTY